ncbi:MAG: prepilin-type N-terminal cleavage/methylation domain-containing protein [Candidatus Pacebacteria bacterium]|nr:prepilin-type N-terminal cleavage/methylation domain-containing protein [Candidatus Paceibacterota bacterium]
MNKRNQNQKGFTLVEMLVSVFIISFSLISIFNINSKYNQQTLQEKESFVATLIAQEGIEIVKNLRDTNSLSNACWLKGVTEDANPGDPCEVTIVLGAPQAHIPTCVNDGCEVDYANRGGTGTADAGLTDWGSAFVDSETDPADGHFLYLKNGFYGYDTSNATWTPYRRRIIVSYPSAGDTDSINRLDIRVIVYWKGKRVEVRQQIYNWRGDPV